MNGKELSHNFYLRHENKVLRQMNIKMRLTVSFFYSHIMGKWIQSDRMARWTDTKRALY